MEAYVKGAGNPIVSNKPFSEDILNAVQQHSIQFPNRAAFIEAENPHKQITFDQFYHQCQSISAFLQSNNFKKGDVVCIVQPNSWFHTSIFLGVSQLGGILSGISVSYTKYEIQHHLNECQPKILFVNNQFLDLVLSVAKEVKSIQLIVKIDSDGVNNQIHPNIVNFNDVLKTKPKLVANLPKIDIDKDIVILPFSSGTTGRPKGVKLTHRNMSSLLHTYTWYGKNMLYPHLEPNFDPTQECFLHFLPQHHMFGFSMMLIAMAHGFTGIVMKKYVPELFLHCIQKYKIKHLHVVPPIALFLAKSPSVDKFDLSSLRSLYFGAAPIGQQLRNELKKRLKLKSVTQGYGLTESTLSFFRPTYSNDPPMSSGKLQGYMEAKIIDLENGKTLKIKQVGELCVRGDLVMAGYLNNDKATKETFIDDGWLKTGDIGYLNEDGFLFIVDRLKEMIKVNGRQVGSGEIEDIIRGYPKVHDVTVIGIKDQKHGEVPKAYIVKKDPSLNANEIHEILKDKVSSFKQLRGGISFVQEIPKSSSGKVLRRKLKELNDNKAKL